MTEALETPAGRRGWIISDGKAGNDVQTRGVFEALGLDYEIKRVAPARHLEALSPWGPVSPAERFGTPAEPVPSALARLRHRHRPADHALHPPAQAAGRARHLHRHPAEPEGAARRTADLFWVPEHDTRRGPTSSRR